MAYRRNTRRSSYSSRRGGSRSRSRSGRSFRRSPQTVKIVVEHAAPVSQALTVPNAAPQMASKRSIF